MTEQRLNEIREIVADVLEMEPEEITDDGNFVEEYEADSLGAIEVLSQLERRYNVDIPQEELARMSDLRSVFEVVREYAKWEN
ncbi:acyl carrier protein [Actinomadura barringtoniae]|uniref:Acyl carrier protein n=1 Tax=Actinomadura barringtoniae TaxID=1427535 RepID=A0A939PAC1_9ACTN|nr:acyl carrier protein [Actinomadura barringtoniae]MBO2445919.1 acyl carrier protein [Actinomadura barringtoniae]